MSIKVWSIQVDRDEDYTDADFEDISVLEDLRVTRGVPLRSQWPRVTLEVTTDYPPADTFRCGPLLIVSAKLLQIIGNRVDERAFEPLPVTLIYRDETLTDYFFLNILEKHDILDRQRSELTIEDDFIEDVESMVVNEEAIGDRNFFLQDSLEVILFVSDDLAKAIIDAGCNGVKFVDPPDWRPY